MAKAGSKRALAKPSHGKKRGTASPDFEQLRLGPPIPACGSNRSGWTTDAVYRETSGKIRRRRAEGCLAVEMEAAAFFAVARFRGVRFGQLLYAGDDVGGEAWDSRHWDSHTTVREKLFWLAAEACLRL